MASSRMLRRVALVRTDVSEELSTYFIRVTRIGELGTTLALTNIFPSSTILVTLMMEALRSSETSVLTRATQHNILEDAIFQCFHHFFSIRYLSAIMWISPRKTFPPTALRHRS
jgi:hypothetical protein